MAKKTVKTKSGQPKKKVSHDQFARYIAKDDEAAVKAGMNIRYRCIVAVTCKADELTTIDEGMEYEYTISVDPVTLVSIDVTENDSWDDCADLAIECVERTTGKRGFIAQNFRSDRKLRVYM